MKAQSQQNKSENELEKTLITGALTVTALKEHDYYFYYCE